jgi:hypothetical protein
LRLTRKFRDHRLPKSRQRAPLRGPAWVHPQPNATPARRMLPLWLDSAVKERTWVPGAILTASPSATHFSRAIGAYRSASNSCTCSAAQPEIQIGSLRPLVTITSTVSPGT